MRLFGLIGFPLSHSFSPEYFNYKFNREHIDADYRLFPLDAISAFPDLLVLYPQLSGLNVTIPYKEKIISYMDRLDPLASAIGAVNCIRFNENRLEGYNTDAMGFYESILSLLQPWHRSALVLGNGGASKAIRYILQEKGIGCLTVSRSATADSISYQDLDKNIIENHLLIINTTPLGMYPHESDAPDIPYEYLTGRHLLYDVVYNPAETLFLRQGSRKGAVVKNGYDMLLNQAEASWNIWNS